MRHSLSTFHQQRAFCSKCLQTCLYRHPAFWNPNLNRFSTHAHELSVPHLQWKSIPPLACLSETFTEERKLMDKLNRMDREREQIARTMKEKFNKVEKTLKEIQSGMLQLQPQMQTFMQSMEAKMQTFVQNARTQITTKIQQL